MLPLLDPSIPLQKVAAHVKMRWKQHQRVELELCLGLRRLFRDNIHRGVGLGDFANYAQIKFDIPAKLAWTFSILGKHLERLPQLVEAMLSGDLTYTKAREFAPYIDPEHQADWIEFARTHNNRQVEQRVGKWNAEQKGEEFVEKKKVTTSLNGIQSQTVREAREKLLKDTKTVVPESDILPVLAEMFVNGKIGAPETESQADQTGESSKPAAPYLTINACPSCLTTFVPVPGANMPVAAFEFLDRLRQGAEGGDLVNLAQHFFCDCQSEMHRRDECPKTQPKVEIPDGQVSRYVSTAAKRIIKARDGSRCSIPGCMNQLPMEGGHLHPFCENGPPTPENMATQCYACNALIEEGRLRVVGVAPYEKYYLADGTYLGYGFDPTPIMSKPDPEVPHVGQDSGAGRVEEGGPDWDSSSVP